MDSKKPLQSKTLWLNLMVALIAFFPEVSEAVKSNPEYSMVFFALVNFVLRLVTKGKIELS